MRKLCRREELSNHAPVIGKICRRKDSAMSKITKRRWTCFMICSQDMTVVMRHYCFAEIAGLLLQVMNYSVPLC